MKSTDRFNEEFTMMLLREALPEAKKAVLRKALYRNFCFTSAYVLEHGTLTVYKEGWYIELDGCQCGYKVFVMDNDRFDPSGTVPYRVIRKPADSKLSFLHKHDLYMWEGDFEKI